MAIPTIPQSYEDPKTEISKSIVNAVFTIPVSNLRGVILKRKSRRTKKSEIMVSQIREVIDLVVDNEMEVVDIDDNDDEVEAVDIADDNDLQIVDIAVDGDDEIDVDNADYDDEVEVIARDDIVLLEIDELDSDIEQADSAYGGGSDDEYHDVREDLLDRRQLNRLNREAVYCVNYIYFTENHRSKYCVSCYFDVRDMFEGLRKRCGHYSERFIAMRGIFCTNCGGPLHQIVTRDMCPTCLNVYRADCEYYLFTLVSF